MLVEESVWIKDTLTNYFSENNFPILNVGSSTAQFRQSVQPFIHSNIFEPLLKQNKNVIHLDIKKADGVDIEGDLTKEDFRSTLLSLNVNSILCSNLLEHLKNPEIIALAMLQTLNSGGLLLVTVPHFFPYHNDPIDTMFRPSVEKLHQLFPNTEIVVSSVVKSKDCYYNDLMRNKRYLGIMLARLFLPFYKFSEWKFIVKDMINAKKKYSATCILIKKL